MTRAQKEVSRLGWVSAPRLLAVAVLAASVFGAGVLRFGPPATGVAAPAISARQAAAPTPAPDGCSTPNRQIHLYAVELPKDPVTKQVRLGYGLTAKTAAFPGPTIEMTEGDCLAVTLHNTVPAATLEALRTDSKQPLAVSLHAHGVKYLPSSDGTVHTGSYVASGGQRTYVWYAKPRSATSQGTAGYWWYHDHMVGGPHGTPGVGAGLFGALVVRRQGDVRPNRTYVTAFGDRQSINLRRGAATDTCAATKPVASPTCLIAKPGERVEFVVIGLGNDMHTFHLHGHSWADTRTGTLDGTDKALVDSVPVIDNKAFGPGDSFGVTVVAGDSVGAGNWMLHCHMQFHSDQGMSTMLHVLKPDGTVVQHQH